MSTLIGAVCDRCGACYGVPAAVWPGRGLRDCCDLTVPVWQRHHYIQERARAA